MRDYAPNGPVNGVFIVDILTLVSLCLLALLGGQDSRVSRAQRCCFNGEKVFVCLFRNLIDGIPTPPH